MGMSKGGVSRYQYEVNDQRVMCIQEARETEGES